MIIDISTADVAVVYQALVGAVAPRPIAWVTTIDRDGRPNLAPFSFFNVFGANPPVVVFSPVLRRDRSKKDTLVNLEEVGEFVISAAVNDLIQQVNETSRELDKGESEATRAGLTLAPSARVRPPRVAESPVHLECRVRQIIAIGDGPSSGNLVVGDVVLIHIDDKVLDAHGRVDPRKLELVGRLGGNYYCRATDLFELERP